jgi:hypothetical protein
MIDGKQSCSKVGYARRAAVPKNQSDRKMRYPNNPAGARAMAAKFSSMARNSPQVST